MEYLIIADTPNKVQDQLNELLKNYFVYIEGMSSTKDQVTVLLNIQLKQ